MRKILIILTNHNTLGSSGKPTGLWLSELTHFLEEVAKVGYSIDFVSPQGGYIPIDPASTKSAESQKWIEDQTFIERLKTTHKPEQIHPVEYSAVYYPGGHGPMWDIASDTRLAALSFAIYTHGGFICAACHGVAGLLPITLHSGESIVQGQKLTGFSNLEEYLVRKHKYVPFLLETELKKHGAQYSKAWLPGLSHVVLSDRIITGQNPASVKELTRVLLEKLAAGK